ncbi:UNKNOWN [Stylonychia lemnae]|uniref:CS domain-containing protein n=1 Tax=Stylonychia lemnae TaxID=5949 RepID=A0A078B7R2_STYLE|nr:UNKNOWN [Stylonychia lemnae]|eukprot:CDW89593.1 UNKNOWN [Stylonychia lemnae]
MENNKVFNYEVSFNFWAPVNNSSLNWKYHIHGMHNIVIQKLTKPARWRTLYKEDEPKPPMIRLWVDKHKQYQHQLFAFKDDEIQDFEGWELIDSRLRNSRKINRKRGNRKSKKYQNKSPIQKHPDISYKAYHQSEF